MTTNNLTDRETERYGEFRIKKAGAGWAAIAGKHEGIGFTRQEAADNLEAEIAKRHNPQPEINRHD